jgi:UDP-N-acetylmuramoyl-L-alanyl-D-glutamate--2,6-diaminopimelate ligase
MRVKDLITHLPGARVEGAVDREITSMAYDSRRVTPGTLFVAVPGQRVDGGEFMADAVDRGAPVVLCHHDAVAPARVTRIRVDDVREAMARASAAFYGRPSSSMKLVGVTGTNGKTTVAFMVKAILEASGSKTGLMGTVRYEVGDRVIPAQRTTPESVDIQQMLAQMVRADCQACVMEVSSHALDQKRVWGIGYDVAIFTNLTQDHLDYHGTMESYFASKARLFTPDWESDKIPACIINIDDDYGARLAAQTKQVSVRLTYGVEKSAELRATQLELGRDGSRFLVETADKSFACRLPLIGRHNVYNALAAIGAALVLGIPVRHIQAALNSLPPVPGRLEAIHRGQPFGVYVDYAHTDDALQNVLTTLREITRGRVLLVFGCGGARDVTKRPKMGRVAGRLADYTIITSDNPRREPPAEIAAQIERGLVAVRNDQYHVELERRRAIDEAIRMAQPGDTVLIAGKGHETYQEFSDTVVPFDDRLYAAETLELLGHKTGRS